MFEDGEVLLTLQLAVLPENQLDEAPQLLTAKRLVDHRLHYLAYEGEISRTRGNVRRIAKGTYSKSQSVQRPEYTIFVADSESLYAEMLIADCKPGDSTKIIIHHWQLALGERGT